MNWHPPVPLQAIDDTGRPWLVHRAWPDKTPEEYILEVRTPGRTGVRAAHFRGGRLELVRPDDPGLPCLESEGHLGEIIAHRAHRRAVIRGDGCYIKIFRPRRALAAVERCEQVGSLLVAGSFVSPGILRSSPDVIVFTALPGRTLLELGQDHSAISDETFEQVWDEWAQAWIAQLTAANASAGNQALSRLPVRSPEMAAANLWPWVNRWLRHGEHVEEATLQRDVLIARAEDISQRLLETAPDPMVWAHGDLHDKQVIGVDGHTPLGLLDFDEAAQAEAALDLSNMDVHLNLRLIQGLLTRQRFLTAHNKVLTVAEELHVSPTRFDVYSEAAWLRLACLYVFRPRWGHVAWSFLDKDLRRELLDIQTSRTPLEAAQHLE